MPMRKGPSLQHFILQAELLSAYRAAVRATRPLPDPQTRRETLDWLRSDIERLKGELDDDVIRHNLSSFRRNLKTFAPSLGISGLIGPGAKLIGQQRK